MKLVAGELISDGFIMFVSFVCCARLRPEYLEFRNERNETSVDLVLIAVSACGFNLRRRSPRHASVSFHAKQIFALAACEFIIWSDTRAERAAHAVSKFYVHWMADINRIRAFRTFHSLSQFPYCSILFRVLSIVVRLALVFQCVYCLCLSS